MRVGAESSHQEHISLKSHIRKWSILGFRRKFKKTLHLRRSQEVMVSEREAGIHREEEHIKRQENESTQ